MKKIFMTALAATAMATSANAGVVALDMRADHISEEFNQAAGQRNTSRFAFRTIRVNYEGKVMEDVSFRLRGAYNKNATSQTPTVTGTGQQANAGDNSVTALEFAYLTHKMGDLAFTIGRMSSEQGGLESATSGADLYLTSLVYTKTGANNASLGSWLRSNDLLYVNGAKLAYTIMPDNTISLVAFEAPIASQIDNANMTGLAYKGAFMEKALRVAAAYHQGNGLGTTADKYDLYSFGIGWTANPVAVSVEYLSSGYKQDSSGNKDIGTSIVGKLAYTGMDNWTPRLEVISSENKLETSSTAANNRTHKYMGYGAVVEYRPYGGEMKDFRYHAAYQSLTQDQATGGDMTAQTITVGARLYADFLK